MEVVLFIVGLAVGIAIGWFVWDRVGSKRLNDDFARRLRHTDDQINTHRKRADEAEAELEPLRVQLREIKDERKDLQKQLEKLKSRFDKLKGEKSDLDASVADIRKRADDAERLKSELSEKQQQLDAARKEADDLRLQLGTVDDLRDRLTSAQDRLVEAERAKEDARLRSAEAQEVTERATVELEAAMDTINTLREGAAGALDLQHELDASKSTIAELEATVARQSEELVDLREQLAASAVVTDDRGSSAVEPEDVVVSEPVEHVAIVTDEQPEGITEESTESPAQNEPSQEEPEATEAEPNSAPQTEAPPPPESEAEAEPDSAPQTEAPPPPESEAEAEPDSAPQTEAPPPPESEAEAEPDSAPQTEAPPPPESEAEAEPDSAPQTEPATDRDVAVGRVREIAARTAGGHEAANDDLKKIHGVGPKLEKLLKSMGITSFLQVANFTSEDIETVTLALDAFPGRIERDDWVGSADQLYREKYESD